MDHVAPLHRTYGLELDRLAARLVEQPRAAAEQQRRLVIVTTNHEWRELAGRVGGPTASRLRRLTRELHVDARDDYRERAAA